MSVDLSGVTLEQPARLELPYDPAKLPPGATDEELFAAYFDESANEWVPAVGVADESRSVLIVQTTHASWWQPWTWDLDAAINAAIAAVHLDFDEITEPFGWYDGCAQAPTAIRFETSGNPHYLAFCAERDEARTPTIRVINRRTFVVRLTPAAGSVPANPSEPRMMFNAERHVIELDFSGSDGNATFIADAQIDVAGTLAVVVADLIGALPGVESELADDLVLAIYGCIAENAHLVRALDALVANDVARFKEEASLAVSDIPSVDCVADLITAAVPKDKLLYKVTKRVLKPLLTKFAAASALYQIGDGIYNAFRGPGRLTVRSDFVSLGQIAYASDGNIWVMNSDGSNRRQLTNDGISHHPRWSPDGRRIAFVSGTTERDIFLMNADGSGRRNLTNRPGDDIRPTWAPDGSRIAFERFYLQTSPVRVESGIFVMNADGSGLAPLPNTETDSAPDWSPDGRQIAFVQTKAIWLMSADGGNRRPLSEGGLPYTLDPVWSPDGSRIAFGSIPPMSIRGRQDIYVFEISSGHLSKLTNTQDNFDPTWSPDGSKIVFTSSREGNAEIYIMNADGSGQVRITNSADAESSPSWNPVP